MMLLQYQAGSLRLLCQRALVGDTRRQRPRPRRVQQQQQVRCRPAAAAPLKLPDLDPDVYTDSAKCPAPFLGPVAAAVLPGRGRGLVATADLQPGQLLLVVPPLATVQAGGLGDIPEHDELQEVIAASGALFSPWQADWLRALTQHTSSSSDAVAADSTPQLLQLPSMLPPPSQAAWSGSSSDGGGAAAPAAGSEGRVPFSALGMSDEQLWAAIVLNCFGEQFQDLPASLCAGAPLTAHLGLWGPFSLLNHACNPNAINYTLGDVMVVRAATRVTAGEEVTINYLGRSALRPLQQRQAELQACYDFVCGCARCQAEASWAGVAVSPDMDGNRQTLSEALIMADKAVEKRYPLLQELRQLHQEAKEEEAAWLTKAAAEAAAAGSAGGDSSSSSSSSGVASCVAGRVAERWEAVARLQCELLDLRELLVRPCSPNGSWFGLHPESAAAAAAAAAPAEGPDDAEKGAQQQQQQQQQPDAAWVQASAFDLLSLLYDTMEVQGSYPGESLHACVFALEALVGVCASVCPGSDLHLFQALRWTSIAQQLRQQVEEQPLRWAGGNEAAVEQRAFDGLQRALALRYGPAVVADEALLAKMVAATTQAAAMVAF